MSDPAVPSTMSQNVSHGSMGRKVFRGSAILLASTAIVAIINLIYNISLAHLLGAAGFGDTTAVYTLLMLSSAATLSFQLVGSKYIARAADASRKASVYRHLLRRAWQFGIVLAVVLVVAGTSATRYLNLASPSYLYIFSICAAAYIPLGVRRGRMQGCYDFIGLAVNVIVEALVKFSLTLLLIAAGLGVLGAILGMAVSVWVAYLTARPGTQFRSARPLLDPDLFQEGLQAAVFFSSQVIISNLDILLVKHYFASSSAGVYAGVALVGRVVYMLAWSVVTSMFPASASIPQERTGRSLLRASLLLVACITSIFVLALWAVPESVWSIVLGSEFLIAAKPAFATLLTLYAAMTAIYSIAIVLITYEMSRRIGLGSWIQLGASAAVAFGIVHFHESLLQVIVVQMIVMTALLLAVSTPLWTRIKSEKEDTLPDPLCLLRKVSVDEVIAEFLRAEFYHKEFDRYRLVFRSLVNAPDLSNDAENRMRRWLLFQRRGKLWRELPLDTVWWEIEVRRENLSRIRAFPRNNWRRFAKDGFSVATVVENIRQQQPALAQDPFVVKLQELKAALLDKQAPRSILLIGEDRDSPLTIIEGNHRMAAALLLDPNSAVERFRFYCGLSAAMSKCCWYKTDFRSLLRYACHRIWYVGDDRGSSLPSGFGGRVILPEPSPEIETN